ncbi:hypothetical protein Tcan_03257 [Toxocara canis]|uniref:Uncharacterized protein n=1 Tax=Toxocara canis TaxID=6265 RepID=A0A0B2VGX0_TOXCA|nr:hypothetical protein Tcan_03257 [Toxocara canis]
MAQRRDESVEWTHYPKDEVVGSNSTTQLLGTKGLKRSVQFRCFPGTNMDLRHKERSPETWVFINVLLTTPALDRSRFCLNH